MEKKEEKKFAISNNFSLFEFGRNSIGTPRINEKFNPKDPWINFGDDNLYPQELVRLYQNADGLHAALIKRKADMIGGLGFVENPAMDEFIKNKYSQEDLEKTTYKIAFDVVLFGGYYLNIIWSLDRKSIAKIEHVPFEKVRIAKPESEYNSEIHGYYISRDWARPRREENKPQFINAFSEDQEEKLKHPSQLLFVKIYTPGMDFYCLPSYAPITNYLKLSYEVSTFHLKSCQNSYLPGMIVSIPHVPGPIEREKMTADIKARSGTDENGQTVVVYGESPDKMPTFTVINPIATDTKFKDLSIQMNENIYVGHNANNIIAGVAVAGKLGNTTEVKEQYSIFQKTVITPLQNNIEKTLNMIAKINGFAGELKLKEYTSVVDDTLNNPNVNSDPGSSVDTPVDVEAAAKASLKGSIGGVQGILAIQAGVVAGTTTYDSALAILDLIYGINNVDARKILGQPKSTPPPSSVQTTLK